MLHIQYDAVSVSQALVAFVRKRDKRVQANKVSVVDLCSSFPFSVGSLFGRIPLIGLQDAAFLSF